MNGYAIAAATVASFVLSGAWYALFGNALARLSPAYAEPGGMRPAPVLLELLRAAVLATVVAAGCRALDLSAAGAAGAALVAWVGFPAVLLGGSVLHERVPWRLAAIHAGDWLLKLLAVSVIVAAWR